MPTLRFRSLALLTLLIEAVLISGQSVDQSEAELLLQKYGFLSLSLQEYGRNATEEEYRSAISDLQYMAGLPETGEMDEQTEQKLIGQRCGRVDDVSKFRNKTRSKIVGLSRRSYTWAVTRYHPSNSINAVNKAIKQAFTFWASETGLRFNELIIGRPQDADIQLTFVNRSHGDAIITDGTGGEVAHAWGAGEINPLVVHFDIDERWNLDLTESPPPGTLSLLAVAKHEIGHVLGLEHSINSTSVMYPWFDNSTDAQLTNHVHESLDQFYSQEGDLLTSTTEQTATTTMTESSIQKPAACPGTVDATLLTKNMIFFFKNDRVWSIDKRGKLLENGTSIHLLWQGLPTNFTKIDAVYERMRSSQVIFFIKEKYFVFRTNMRKPSAPEAGYPITDYCLPPEVNHIDAVFTWDHNSMTYLISGNKYWRFDEYRRTWECPRNPVYPKPMRVWGGVPLPVDAVLKSHSGNLYFFHKEHYWQFDDWSMSINTTEPQLIDDWIGCRGEDSGTAATTASSNASTLNSLPLTLLLAIVCCS